MATLFELRQEYTDYATELASQGKAVPTFEEFVKEKEPAPPRESRKKKDDSQSLLDRIRRFADGGHVVGDGTGTSDDVPAMLSAGEYIMPADVVEALGLPTLDRLVQKFHTPVKGGTK